SKVEILAVENDLVESVALVTEPCAQVRLRAIVHDRQPERMFGPQLDLVHHSLEVAWTIESEKYDVGRLAHGRGMIPLQRARLEPRVLTGPIRSTIIANDDRS